MTVEVKGLAELQANLKALEPRLQKNAMVAAVRAGARVVVTAARNNLPANYTTLRKALTLKVLRPKYPHRITAIIGPTVGKNAKHDGWYAHIVERGAAPHDITLSTKKAFQIASNLNVVSGSSGTPGVMKHPGLPARPFLQPAIRNNQSAVLQAIKDKLWAGIEKAARK